MSKHRLKGQIRNRDPTKWHLQGLSYMKMFIKTTFLLFLFYQNIPMAVLIGAAMGVYGVYREGGLNRRRWQQQMNLEFREALQGIAAALNAGYSVENAFSEASKDLQLLYGSSSVLVPEMQEIMNKTQLNYPIEKALFELADRSGVEDIQRFAEVFQTAKRTGGDLIAITKTSADRICEKIEVKREIASMIAGKEMEAKIMKIIPLGMIVYFQLCSPGFLDPLYQGQGRIMMTVLLLLYLIAFYWSERITRIDV